MSVGYEYQGGASCGADSPIWVKRRVEVRGFDVDISAIGGWNLDIHHHYNSDQGRARYLQKRVHIMKWKCRFDLAKRECL